MNTTKSETMVALDALEPISIDDLNKPADTIENRKESMDIIHNVSFKITSATHEFIKHLAKEQGCSTAQMMSMLLTLATEEVFENRLSYGMDQEFEQGKIFNCVKQ